MSQNNKEKTIAEQLAKDPRIAQAKKLLLAAVHDQQTLINEIRPPKEGLKKNYELTLNAFIQQRGSKLFYPYLGSGIGKGALVELLDGSIKYDFISGIGVHFFGHTHPDLIAASIDAAISDTIMQGHLQQNEDTTRLSQLLVKASNMEHCFFTTSGAMANENALKLAFQKKYPASRILAFDRCFMGRTLALSQISDKPTFREGLPSNILVDYVPFFDHTQPEKSTQSAIAVLKRHLQRYPKEYAVFCFELIQGEAGFYPGSREFFEPLMQILKEHGVVVLVDEVQTFGRTPSLFAFHHFGLEKYVDIVTIGKLSQVCATLFSKDFRPLPGLLSQTFTASTSTIHAAFIIIQRLLQGHFFGSNGKIQQIHEAFVTKLQALEKRYPDRIQGPFGIGAMIAFTPFGGEQKKVTQFAQDLFQEGVISFIAGSNPTRIRFLVPAGAITFEDIDQVMQLVETVLKNK